MARFANPRNAAAGDLRALDLAGLTASRRLDFYPYLLSLRGSLSTASIESLEGWQAGGSKVNPNRPLCQRHRRVARVLRGVGHNREACLIIDGVVLKVIPSNAQRLGWSRPGLLAGRSHTITPRGRRPRSRRNRRAGGPDRRAHPVAHLRPFRRRAPGVSRHTHAMTKSPSRRADGDEVAVERSGDVIPRVFASSRGSGRRPFHMPKHCSCMRREHVRER